MDFLLLLPLLVSAVGVFLLVRLKAFFILHPIRTARDTLAVLRHKGNASALTLALAGTLGVGNIFGVAMGIILGGAGSIFWLLLSSLFSAVIKYAEVLLSHDAGRGGMARVIRASLGRLGAFSSYLYSALCLVLAFVMGSALQSRSLSGTVEGVVGMSRILIAAALAVILIISIAGGVEKIQRITGKILPLSSIIYILMAFFVIIRNFSQIPDVILEIFSSAFSWQSAGAGMLSYGFVAALREGYSRGVMSNEAGVGTSSLAHGRGNCDTPHEAGLLGIFEVFFDTALVCGITGLAILLGVRQREGYTSGMQLVLDAFSCLGDRADTLILFCVCSFAVSSALCWYFYGDECRRHLFGKRFGVPYTLLFVAFSAVGVFAPDGFSVKFVDTVLLFMSIPTLASLVLGADKIKRLTPEQSKKTRRAEKARRGSS